MALRTDSNAFDVLVADLKTGLATGLAKTVRRAVSAMDASGVPYSVIGASALAAHGFPRMTRDLDIVVMNDHADAAIRALRKARFIASTPVRAANSLKWIVFRDPKTDVSVDLIFAEGDPEALAISEASRAILFGVEARVATLEHLLLLYLYSVDPMNLGDFASIVQSGRADLGKAEKMLLEMNPKILPTWRKRVKGALHPPAVRAKPKRRKPQ